MIKPNDQLQEIARGVADLMLQSQGRIVRHAEIEVVTGARHKSSRYYSIIEVARRILLNESQFALRNIRDEGYELPTGENQLKLGGKKIRRGVRQMKRGTKVIEATADERLPEPARQQRDHVVSVMHTLLDASNRSTRQIKFIVPKVEALPPPTETYGS